MSTHNIGFYEDLTKIIFELSSNTHLISSAGSSAFSPNNHFNNYFAETEKKCISSHGPSLDPIAVAANTFLPLS